MAQGYTQQKFFLRYFLFRFLLFEDVVRRSAVPWAAGMVQACLLDSSALRGLWTCIPTVGFCGVLAREMAANVAQ